MRPATLAEAYERIIAGDEHDMALSEFLDTFYLAPTPERRIETLRRRAAADRGRAPRRIGGCRGRVPGAAISAAQPFPRGHSNLFGISIAHGIRPLLTTIACANI